MDDIYGYMFYGSEMDVDGLWSENQWMWLWKNDETNLWDFPGQNGLDFTIRKLPSGNLT